MMLGGGATICTSLKILKIMLKSDIDLGPLRLGAKQRHAVVGVPRACVVSVPAKYLSGLD